MDEPHAFHSLRSLRYRRCPSCETVRPASEFQRGSGPVNASDQRRPRTCPECGHVGPLMTFAIIERPESGEQP